MSSTVLQNALRLLFIALIIFNCCHGAPPRVKPKNPTDEKTSTNEIAGISVKLWIIIGVSVLLILVVVCAIVVICCLCRGSRADRYNHKIAIEVPSSFHTSRQGPTDSVDWPPTSAPAGHGHGRGGRSGGGAITAVPSGMMSKMPTTKTKQPFSWRSLIPESLRSTGPSPSTATVPSQSSPSTATVPSKSSPSTATVPSPSIATIEGGGDQTKLKASSKVPSGGEHYTTW